MTSILPVPVTRFFSPTGVPLASGVATFYIPGTTTPKDIWKDYNQTILSPNPVTLDASGGAIIWGQGQYRVVLTDSLGNQQFDAITSSNDFGISLSSLGVSNAMIPVLEAATLADAAALLTGNTSGHLNISNGDQSIVENPTANGIPTNTTMNVQGTTSNGDQREFLFNAGLVSNVGNGGTVGNDKVTIYSGLEAKSGTADVWTLNTCLTMDSGSGSYNAQGYELDFNNLNADRGNVPLGGGVGAPVAYGLSISGASTFKSTAAILITGAKNQWNRGLLFAGAETFVQDCIEDISGCPTTIKIAGGKTYAIDATNATFSGAAFFLPNSATITWQTGDKTGVSSDLFDSFNNRYIGLGTTGGVFMGAHTAPVTNNVFSLGTPANRWNALYMANGSTINWNNAANNAVITDGLDANNNRTVGVGASGVFLGGTLLPIATNGSYNAGSTANPFGTMYAINGVVTTSDIELKTEVESLPSMLTTVNAINPITFKWKDGGDGKMGNRIHWGFSAEDIKNQFTAVGKDFGGYVEDPDGRKGIRSHELIAVMWKAIQELSAEVVELKKKG